MAQQVNPTLVPTLCDAFLKEGWKANYNYGNECFLTHDEQDGSSRGLYFGVSVTGQLSCKAKRWSAGGKFYRLVSELDLPASLLENDKVNFVKSWVALVLA